MEAFWWVRFLRRACGRGSVEQLGPAPAGDQFGFSVARAGDVDEDGVQDIIVGAPFNDAAGSKAGRAYVYLGGSGTLYATKTGKAAGNQFGRTVSGAGDASTTRRLATSRSPPGPAT